ncbi:hypothetical protein INR49_012780 [Caranx melampygus]|nr:hypothetical protein INR49_012780 [Caranx melampygus]
MTAYCTATTQTQCAPCKDHHFTELYNYLPRCLYCNNFCTENQEVETECSAVRNRVCRCKEGFYWVNDFCVRHSECEPGQGVLTQGTRQTDTVCETCPDGFFSNLSSALVPCVKHRECPSGQIALLPDSIYQDTVCGTCEDLAKGGEALRTFLSGVFGMQKMRVAKMKKFVTRYIEKSVLRQRGPLLQEIRAWLAEAPEEQLRKLPQMLKVSQLSSVAEKLEKSILEINQRSPGCNFDL